MPFGATTLALGAAFDRIGATTLALGSAFDRTVVSGAPSPVGVLAIADPLGGFVPELFLQGGGGVAALSLSIRYI